MDYKPTDAEQQAIDLIQNEITNWEEGEVFVTDDQSFIMKNVVKNARKNYFGIFKKPYDPVTKRKKLFVPLTEKLVEDIVKLIDIDTKDIKVKSKNYASHIEASIFRYVLAYYLDKVGFGKIINDVIRLCAIDGTAFVKTWKENRELKMRVVDRLNIIVDPSANDLSETPIIERHFISIADFRKEAEAQGWDNTEYVTGDSVIRRGGFDEGISNNISEVPMVTVYERYGWTDKYFITGKEKDKGEYVMAMIIYTDTNGAIIHKIKEVKKQPFTVFKYKSIWNRFDGRGIAEMVFTLQSYINEVVNTRMNTARIAQLGLFKLEGGVTPQQFKNLFATSAIKMKGRRDNIERIDTGAVDPSSYKEEEFAKGWAIEVTGTLDERNVTASTPATNALIQERGTKQGANLVQENLGFAFTELLEDHVVPIIKQVLKKGDAIRITGNSADFEKLEEKLIEEEVNSAAQEYLSQGGVIDPMEIEAEKERLKQELKAIGEDRFVQIKDKAFDTDFNVNVSITDEEMNPALVAQALTQALGIAAQFPGSRLNTDEALKEIFDSLGLDGNRLIQAQESLGDAQVATQGAIEQQKQIGMNAGQGATEADLNPIPNSRPVV